MTDVFLHTTLESLSIMMYATGDSMPLIRFVGFVNYPFVGEASVVLRLFDAPPDARPDLRSTTVG